MSRQSWVQIISGVVLVLALVSSFSGSTLAQTPHPSIQDLKLGWWEQGELPVRLAPRDKPSADLASPLSVAGLADWSRIALQSFRDENWEIYIARGDGAQPVRLTVDPNSDVRPRLNRDATRVAFSSNRDGNYEIYTINADGLGEARLTLDGASDTSPSWSPDGKRIAFASNRDGNWEIYAINADGSAPVRLTIEGADDIAPAWSPDGGQIAWVRRDSLGNAVWMMNADGANPHALTSPLAYLQNPIWSPDGTRLAFDYDADGDYWNELAVINADGSGLHSVYDANGYLVDVWMGSWSPDGNWLLFSRVEYIVYQNQLYLNYVYVEQVPSAGGGASQLTSTRYDMMPDWRTMDITPPQSRVGNLPQYSRASGIAVQWLGADVGPAGIAGYDLQYRTGSTGAWTNWLTSTILTASVFSGAPGSTVYFRSRARDEAGNIEDWSPADGDAFTTLYTWRINGRVQDIRGEPIPGATVVAFPPTLYSLASQADGTYRGYLTAGENQVLTVDKPSYGDALAMTLDVITDTLVEHVLPPIDNLVQGGEFETGTLGDAWQLVGNPMPSLANAVRHTGNRAVVMGEPFALISTQVAFGSSDPELAIDNDRTIHLVGSLAQDGYHILYSRKPITGNWPITPMIVVTTTTFAEDIHIIPDQNGGIHLVWREFEPAYRSYSNVFYCHKLATTSACTPPENITGYNSLHLEYALSPKLALDRQGGLYLAWTTGASELKYTYRAPGGMWQSPVTIASSASLPNIAVDDLGQVHIVWCVPDPSGGFVNAVYSSKQPNGNWTSPVVIGHGSQWPSPSLAVGPEGTVHVVWIDGQGVFYAAKEPGHGWSTPVWLGTAQGISILYDVGVDEFGNGHVMLQDGSGPIVFMVKTLKGGWHRLAEWNTSVWALAFRVDRLGVAHVIGQPSSTVSPWEYLHHIQTQVAVEEANVGLSQVITIPTVIHQATLAFMHYTPTPLGGSELHATISDGVSTTLVISAATIHDNWKLAWGDLSAWSGQTVTLTVTLHQPAAAPFQSVYLDSIVLGSWLTPIINNVSPSHIKAKATALITITGDNFVAIPPGSLYTRGPMVRLNDIVLSDARWIYTTTLTATVPALPPGLYDLWVTNPDGQEGVRPSGLAVGEQVYLPILLKN